MFRAALFTTGLVALALAAGCQQSGEHATLSEPLAPAAAEAAMPAYALHYLDMGETVRLAYGVANSDVVRLMMDCERGAGEIALSDNAVDGAQLLLASDGQEVRLQGAVEPGITSDIVMTQAGADEPALSAFRRTGRLDVGAGASRYAIQAASFERHDIERFFAACETA